MKVGLFGGSFDPIHRGTSNRSSRRSAQLGLDRVVYLPTAQPPHKRSAQLRAGAGALRHGRARAARPAADAWSPSSSSRSTGLPTRSKRSSTSEPSEPEDELVLILGADSFLELSSWRALPRDSTFRPGSRC